MPNDLPLFLNQLLRRPHEIVALAPSSEALAREMAAQLPALEGPVIELGAGTGKITRALLDAGVPPADLHAIEMQPEFAAYLEATFPEIAVYRSKAQEMRSVAPKNARAVVSGLPFLSMPNRVQEAILSATREILAPGGAFVQFTYGPTPPIAETLRINMGLEWRKSRRIWNNLPPARVYTFQFRQH